MKKVLVIAALVSACAFAPVMPAQAGVAVMKPANDCLIFPMFKKSCWEQGAKVAAKVVPAHVTWYGCLPAAKGSKYLLDCGAHKL